jgi:hypothetical protein
MRGPDTVIPAHLVLDTLFDEMALPDLTGLAATAPVSLARRLPAGGAEPR